MYLLLFLYSLTTKLYLPRFNIRKQSEMRIVGIIDEVWFFEITRDLASVFRVGIRNNKTQGFSVFF